MTAFLATAHDIATNLWSAWGLFIAAFVIAFVVLLGLGLCRAAALGDIGPIDTSDVLDDLIDGDTWATQQYLAGNLPGYERLLDAVDDPIYETRLWIAALPETRTR